MYSQFFLKVKKLLIQVVRKEIQVNDDDLTPRSNKSKRHFLKFYVDKKV